MAEHLTDEQRVFVVRLLAVYTPISNIIEMFQHRWPRARIDPLDVVALNPLTGLSDERLNAIYDVRQAEFYANVKRCAPAAQRNVRLHILNQELEKERARGSDASAATIQSLLRQIAEETADAPDDVGRSEKRIDKVEWIIVPPPNEEQ